MKLRDICRIALLTAAALIIFSVEVQIPAPVPIPGVKLGLANVITLVAIYAIGRKNAGYVLFLRIVLGNFLCGQVTAMLFSLAGGVLCYIVMCIMKNLVKTDQIWVVSVFGAIGHNTGQIIVASFVVGNASVFLYLPVLFLSGIITGVFTGLCAQCLYKHLCMTKLL